MKARTNIQPNVCGMIQAASKLRISVDTLRELVSQNIIPHIHINGEIFFVSTEIERFKTEVFKLTQ